MNCCSYIQASFRLSCYTSRDLPRHCKSLLQPTEIWSKYRNLSHRGEQCKHWTQKTSFRTMATEHNARAQHKSCDELQGNKRENESVNPITEGEPIEKKAKTEIINDSTEKLPFRKKKCAMLMVYSGKGYVGMQRNPGVITIEGELLKALVKGGVIIQDHADDPGPKMQFQRAARTDKGVSAAGQVVSLKINVPSAVEKINAHLPPQILIVGYRQVTKGFCSKNACDCRTYSYMLPTFAFCPIEQIVTEEFRITEDILQDINEVFGLFKGTHNFHNFTSGKAPNDASASRYIMEFEIGKPFVREGLEFAVIKVRGQSFMLHQIRKMIGLTVAIVRGFTTRASVISAWGPAKCDIPKVPGLGLMLEQVHYDHYNQRYGNDGIHEKLAWEEYKDVIDKFKEEYIFPTIIDTEKSEMSMMNWMKTLILHQFAEKDNERMRPVGYSPPPVDSDDQQGTEERLADDKVSVVQPVVEVTTSSDDVTCHTAETGSTSQNDLHTTPQGELT